MSISEICDRRIPAMPSTTSVLAAAKAMHSFGERILVVLDEQAGKRVAAGTVTEHELIGVIAQDEDPSRLTMKDIMCPNPPFVGENDDVLETLCWMRRNHLRDVIVHDKGGALLGMVSLDQLAASVAGELDDVAAHVPEDSDEPARSSLH